MPINIEIKKSLFIAHTGLTAVGYDLINKGDKELEALISKFTKNHIILYSRLICCKCQRIS